ncbi:MAG: hypothetical protein EHM23_33015 [Acidobacteria bacterium]|nr:MAG: hypothetical protein EHM23_33015 [Acidobacteriota bacterium]
MWTVVHDFRTLSSEIPDSDDFKHHPAVMLRVNFRDDAWGVPDQTRFGTIVYMTGFRTPRLRIRIISPSLRCKTHASSSLMRLGSAEVFTPSE